MLKILPSENYKTNLTYFGNFNNQLLSGLNQGLNLYDSETDLKLYKTIDYKPLDRVNFDDVNKQLDENYSHNDDLYNNAKSVVSGAVNGAVETINKIADDTVGNVARDMDRFRKYVEQNIKNVLIFSAVFLIVYKKI